MESEAVAGFGSVRPRRRSFAVAVVVALVALASAVGGGSAAWAEVTASVAPGSALVDGQQVTVSGTGSPVGAYISVRLCAVGDPEYCGYYVGDADSDGSFSVTGPVRAQVRSSSGVVDCRVAACELVVETWDMVTEELVVLARVAAPFDPDAPLLDPPTVTADPFEDLVDGQIVSVTGAGHAPGSLVRVYQCPGADDDDHSCRRLGSAPVGADGSIATTVAVAARLPGDIFSGVEPLDCRTAAVPCQLYVSSSWGSAQTALFFDPDAPLAPGPSITVNPASGLAEGDTITVEGSGFTPEDAVDLQLCVVGTSRCDLSTDLFLATEPDGSFVTEVVVHDEVVDREGFTDCRMAPGCEVRVLDWSASYVATAALSFRPRSAPSVRYVDPVFTDVEVVRGLVFRNTTDVDGEPVELALDIYLPVGDTAQERPAVMWMFGGWFMFGDREQLAAYAMDSARRGYVGITIDYRTRPGMDLADVLDAAADAEVDARAAVDWLKANAGTYRIDPDAMVAAGVSSGAVLAWNLAYGSDDEVPGPSPVAAAVPISGVPFSGPEAGAPPVIAFHAVDDGVLPIGPGRETCPLAATVGAVCRFVEMPDGGHYVAESRSREIVATTYPFLVEHLLRPLGYLAPAAPNPPGPPVRPEIVVPRPAGPPPGGPTTSTTAPPSPPVSSVPTPPSTSTSTPTSSSVPGPTAPAASAVPPPPSTGTPAGSPAPPAAAARPVPARPGYTG